MRTLAHNEIEHIVTFPTKAETAHAAAQQIIDVVHENPYAAITYATGDTMIPVYAALAEAVRQKKVDFSKTQAFHLDEYYPYASHQDFSFVAFLQQHVFAPLRIASENINLLDGTAVNGDAEARRYDALVSQGISIALLGIGPGGHIGFNERFTPFDTRTHLAQLSDETVYRDQVDRGQDTPDKALTQGIGTILEAELLLMVAYGAKKGEYLHEALYQPISTRTPASALRLVGDKVTIMMDEPAANVLVQNT